MENLRLERLQKRNSKDNGNSCRVFFDKQLNYNSTAIFWHRRFFELKHLKSCKICYTESVARYGRPLLAKYRITQYKIFTVLLNRVRRQSRISNVLETVVDGRDHDMPRTPCVGDKKFVKEKMHE